MAMSEFRLAKLLYVFERFFGKFAIKSVLKKVKPHEKVEVLCFHFKVNLLKCTVFPADFTKLVISIIFFVLYLHRYR